MLPWNCKPLLNNFESERNLHFALLVASFISCKQLEGQGSKSAQTPQAICSMQGYLRCNRQELVCIPEGYMIASNISIILFD